MLYVLIMSSYLLIGCINGMWLIRKLKILGRKLKNNEELTKKEKDSKEGYEKAMEFLNDNSELLYTATILITMVFWLPALVKNGFKLLFGGK